MPAPVPPEPDRGAPVVTPALAAVADLETRFREATGHTGPVATVVFGDSPGMADDLAALVGEGTKRATASWMRDPAAERPEPGRHWIVLDGGGQPVCVVRTEQVQSRVFADVDPAFAWDEGEGDRTLEHWRAVHRAFFERRGEELGIPFDEGEILVLERFRPVHPEPGLKPLVEAGPLAVRVLRPEERGWLRDLLGGEVTAPELLEATGGFPADACPGLVAHRRGRSVGAAVLRPGRRRTRLVATVVLEEDRGVGALLTEAVRRLRRRHGWGPVVGESPASD